MPIHGAMEDTEVLKLYDPSLIKCLASTRSLPPSWASQSNKVRGTRNKSSVQWRLANAGKLLKHHQNEVCVFDSDVYTSTYRYVPVCTSMHLCYPLNFAFFEIRHHPSIISCQCIASGALSCCSGTSRAALVYATV